MANNKTEILEKLVELTDNRVKEDSHEPQLRFNLPPHQLSEKIDLSINEKGVDEATFLDILGKIAEYSVDTDHPFFMNQMYGNQQSAAVIGDIFTTLLNTSMYTYEVAPLMTLIEKSCIEKLCSYVWNGDNHKDGIFTPGGSVSNMMAMVLARNSKFPETKSKGMRQLPRFSIFVSEHAHYSFVKGSMFLGFGQESIVKIKTNRSGKINVLALINAIEKEKVRGNIPLMLVGVAGTTIAGVYDDLGVLGAIARENNMWFHVDAVYGGSLLLSEKTSHRLTGIEMADSVSWNLHKIMGIPLVCAVLLTKYKGVLKSAFSTEAAYLFHDDENDFDLGMKSLQCGRRVDALKLWLAWQQAGEEGFAKRVDDLMKKTLLFANKVRASKELELFCEPQSPIVCFRYKPEAMKDKDVNELNKAIRTRIFEEGNMLFNYSQVGRDVMLRCVISNPGLSVSQIDQIIEKVKMVGSELSKMSPAEYLQCIANA